MQMFRQVNSSRNAGPGSGSTTASSENHELLQKATGWMLREAGKRDPGRLVGYLRKNWDRMPATMRRYACEKLPKDTVNSLKIDGPGSIVIRKAVREDLERMQEIFALAQYDSIRIDTHRDNSVMRNALLREGYRYCGIIHCWNGSERLAYQLIAR